MLDLKFREAFLCGSFLLTIIIIIIIIIGSTALGGPWPPQENFASDLYTGHTHQFLQPSVLASSFTL